MCKKIFYKKFLLITFVLAGIFFQSCKTTQSIARDSVNPEAPGDSAFVIAHDIKFPEVEGDYKYLFLRLYNPHYKNPLYIANILKGGISMTRIDGQPDLSHASINFNLDDCYYGLTLGGKYQLAEEECSFPESNKYMKNCNPVKSEQITYALKVTQEEYENTKKFVEWYAHSTELKYASSLNFKLAMFCIRRKAFSPAEKKHFGTVEYPKKAVNRKVNLEEDENIDYRFVCSSFVGYVLYNNIEDISRFFDENGIKYEYLNVPDISQIPGVVPIFYSNWDNYREAARAFVKEYPEFLEYLTEKID